MSTYYDLFEIPMDASTDMIYSGYAKMLNKSKIAYNYYNKKKMNMELEYPVEFLNGDLLGKIKTVEDRMDYDNTIDPHYILGVSQYASKSEIDAAYQKLSKYSPNSSNTDIYNLHIWTTISKAYLELKNGIKYTNTGPNIYQLLNVPFNESIEVISNKHFNNRIVNDYKNIVTKMISIEKEMNNLDKMYKTLINPITHRSYDEELKSLNLYDVSIYKKYDTLINAIIILLFVLVFLLIVMYIKKRKDRSNAKSVHKTQKATSKRL